MEAVAVEDGSGVGNFMLARGTSVEPVVEVELMRPRQDTMAETGADKTAEQQCEHFSIRGYVALLQKKHPKLCSLSRIFHEQNKWDEQQASSSPFSVANFRRWDCSKCLDKMKISDHRTTPITVSTKKDVTSDGCSITFIRSTLMPADVVSKRMSQGNDADKKGATEANTDVPTKDLQGSTYNYEAAANISDNVSMDVVDLLDVTHITSSKEGNDIDQPPRSSEVPEVVRELNEDDDILVTDNNMTKDPKPMSGQICDQVFSSDRCEEAASKRSLKSDCKEVNKKMMKKRYTNKHTVQVVSDVKLGRRKPQKVRLLSEIINSSQVKDSRGDDGHHENAVDRSEDDRHIIPLELSMDNPVEQQTVGGHGLKSTNDKTKWKGVDVVDDGSSLKNWLKRKKKKIAENVNHDGQSPVDNLSNPIISTQHDDDDNLHSDCQNEPENSTQRCSSKVKTSSLSKRKMYSSGNAKYGYQITGNKIQKIPILRSDNQNRMEPKNSVQRCLSKVSPAKRDVKNVAGLHEQSLPKKRKKQNLEVMHEKQPIIDDIPMDIVELLARNQHQRQLMTETDSYINRTQSKTTADGDCVIVAAMDGPNYAPSVIDTNFQQKCSTSESMQKELHGHLAESTQDASLHPLNLQISDHLKSTQEQQTHLHMDEMVTIAASSPLFPQHYDQYIAEARTECSGHKETKKITWDSFKASTRNSSTAAYGTQFRPSIQAVGLTSTSVIGSSNNYLTHPPVIVPLDDHCTERAISQVQARSFPSTTSTMRAGNLCDRRNAGQSVLYPKEPMPATNLLRIMDPSALAGFPNYEMSSRSQVELQLHNSQYAHNQYRGSTSTSYGNNLNGKVALPLEDLSQRQFQHNLRRPFRPHPRVGVLGSLLQKEIANWSENSGTVSGYRLGVSEGITSHQMKRKEHFEALNSGMFSAKWNALQLGSVSPSEELLSARNSVAQSWTRGKGKMTHPLDKFVRRDICVTNRNPADFTTVSDNNEYMTYR
ncbi:hypothetical protein GUJ93_ZPchr0008g12007 [Zizania palustris]|uniref:Embryonic flower 1-like protein n=1 Tax=Zizania palustris TaxID=103762 RepID=A0A8J5V0Z1_ZIZPA|nr:hypothetical protein GUJ93_ZPchr0008g12007 [Zizania palustris]KAG8045751.1 hypothetical protein GUJ93_ZPchr0008g12007 [Zizania palustris]